MSKLVFSRHGLSEWNALNQFARRVNVGLTPESVEEVKEGGRKIREAGIKLDVVYTPVLTRAIKTCNYLLEYSDRLRVSQIKFWRLNGRHYGKLQGLSKKETVKKHEDEQVHIWHRSYDTLPPLTEAADEGSTTNDRRCAMLDQRDTPGSENLKATLGRVLPSWQDEIASTLKDNKTALVAAHGSSLRALARHIEGISGEDVMSPGIPTDKSLVYGLNNDLTVKEKYYLQELVSY